MQPDAPASTICTAPYNPSSEALYEKLTRKGQMVTVAAPTGRGKTLLAANCVAYVMQKGERVVWVNMDMPIHEVHRRLACILRDIPINSTPDQAIHATVGQLQAANLWHAVQYTSPRSSPVALETILDSALRDGPASVIVIDGFDRLFGVAAGYTFTELCERLATVAVLTNTCIITTSQMKAEAEHAEIMNAGMLAFDHGKAESSGTVVTIGNRVMHKLRTLTIVKDRNRAFSDGELFRVHTRPSLRLEVMEVADAIPMGVRMLPQQVDYVGCAARDIEPDDSEPPATESGTAIRLYHGDNGFIGIGRGVFTSAMHQERDWEGLGRLLSLYEMAAIRDMKLRAPGTQIPVGFKRGQVMTSLRMLGERWGTDKKKVERYLARAERDGLIEVKQFVPDGTGGSRLRTTNDTTGKTLATLVTLCHYDGNDGAKEAYARNSDTTGDPMLTRR